MKNATLFTVFFFFLEKESPLIYSTQFVPSALAHVVVGRVLAVDSVTVFSSQNSQHAFLQH